MGETFINDTNDKSLISKIYKWFIQLNRKKKSNNLKFVSYVCESVNLFTKLK